jgi:hypothetical protein
MTPQGAFLVFCAGIVLLCIGGVFAYALFFAYALYLRKNER